MFTRIPTGIRSSLWSTSRTFTASVIRLDETKKLLHLHKLSYSLTESDITEAFEPIGGVKAVEIFKNPNTGLSLGYGKIEFESEKLANRALSEMQGLVLDNLPIEIKTSEMNKQVTPYDILYIRNVPLNVTEAELLTLFAPYQASRVTLVKSPIRREHMGYGFIRFQSVKSATRALKRFGKYSLRGRKIKLFYAEPKLDHYEGFV